MSKYVVRKVDIYKAYQWTTSEHELFVESMIQHRIRVSSPEINIVNYDVKNHIDPESIHCLELESLAERVIIIKNWWAVLSSTRSLYVLNNYDFIRQFELLK